MLLFLEELYWKQRAKTHWLQAGDASTIAFRRMANGRKKKKNAIVRLVSDDGEIHSDKEGIERVVKD